MNLNEEQIKEINTKLRENPQKLTRKSTFTYNYLKNNGFSEEMINNFFVPFFGSVLLDKDLSTVKSTFETVYKAMSSDNICLPENGIVLWNKVEGKRIRSPTDGFISSLDILGFKIGKL